MGRLDDLFGYLPTQATAEGDGVFELAASMEAHEHFGPAVRMFEWSLDFIEGRADNPAYAEAIEHREQCRQQARACGEDVAVAFEMTSDGILDDVRAFVRSYYVRQAEAISERLRRLTDRGSWDRAVEAARAAAGAVRFATGAARGEAEYQCALALGTALVELGRYDEAVAPLAGAYERAGEQADESAEAARCAVYYGVALFHTGAKAAEAVLADGARRRADLPANDQPGRRADECLYLLAECHARRLAGPPDGAMTAARAIGGLARPDGEEAGARFDEIAARAGQCIKADALLAQAVACRQQRQIDQAAAATDQAAQAARAAGADAIEELIQAERNELSLCDPRQVATHAQTVREMLRSGQLGEADALYGKLHDRQGDNPEVEALGELIVRAKRTEADRQAARATELVAQGKTDEAEAVLAAAGELARGVDYTPAGFAETRGKLNRTKALAMGAEAKRLSEAGEYAAAMAMAKDAGRLEDLDEATVARIAEMLEKLSAGRDRAAMQCRQRLKTLIQDRQWSRARGVLAEAESKGTDGQAQAERKKIEGYFQASDLLDCAEEMLGKSNTADTAATIDQVFAATSVASLLARAKDLQERTAALDRTIATHYVDQDSSTKYLVISAIVGVPLGGALGWLDGGFFEAIWVAAMATAALWGGSICLVKRTIPAHDGRIHGLSLICLGVMGALGALTLWWWACVPVAILAWAVSEHVVSSMCPARKPARASKHSDETTP